MRELLDLEIVMQAHHRLPTRTNSFELTRAFHLFTFLVFFLFLLNAQN